MVGYKDSDAAQIESTERHVLPVRILRIVAWTYF